MDRIRNTMLRSQTQIVDVSQVEVELGWSCLPQARWVVGQDDHKWTSDNSKRKFRRLRRRWHDDLDSFLKGWLDVAQNWV